MDKLTLWRNKKKNLGLTNQEIANRAVLPLRTVEQIMCGKVKNPRLDTVQAIEKALGVSFTKIETPQINLTDKEKIVLDCFRKLNPTMQDYVLKILQSSVALEEEKKGQA